MRRTKTKRDHAPPTQAAPTAPAAEQRGTEITVEAFALGKGRTELVASFAHGERLSQPKTRKFPVSQWERLFAEFCSAPRG